MMKMFIEEELLKGKCFGKHCYGEDLFEEDLFEEDFEEYEDQIHYALMIKSNMDKVEYFLNTKGEQQLLKSFKNLLEHYEIFHKEFLIKMEEEYLYIEELKEKYICGCSDEKLRVLSERNDKLQQMHIDLLWLKEKMAKHIFEVCGFKIRK